MSKSPNSFAAPLIKLAIFAVVTLTATAILATTISQISFGRGKQFHAIFTDATLLNSGDDVRIAGVRVGQVDSVQVHDRTLAEVTFSLDDRSELTANTVAAIRFQSLVGTRYLALSQSAEPVGTPVRSGGTLPLERTTPAVNLTELFNGFKPLFKELSADDVNQLADQIIRVFQGEGGTIESLLANTATLTNTLADKDAVIGELITNLNTVLDTVNNRDDQLTALIDNTESLVSGLAADRDVVGDTVTSLAGLVSSTDSLLTPARASLQADIAALHELTIKLNNREADLNKAIGGLPEKVQKVGRMASFGSWFQFYLCGADLTVGTGAGDRLDMPIKVPTLNLPLYTNSATRCFRDGVPK